MTRGHGPIGSSELGRAEEGPAGRQLDSGSAMICQLSIRHIKYPAVNGGSDSGLGVFIFSICSLFNGEPFGAT